jgi:excisionase family DNA binding protein
MQPMHAVGTAGNWLSVGQAAAIAGVHPDTLKRWEKAGRISSARTPTGHRRFRLEDVQALLVSTGEEPS